MTAPSDREPAPGLCGRCRHARVIESDRGSRFYLCQRARTDPRLRRYPPLPVLECVGFEPVDPESEERPDADEARQ